MSYWMDFGGWEERRRELVREAEQGRLVRELREARSVRGGRAEGPEGRGGGVYAGPGGVRVRWGLVEDEARIADLLELNGMPRWVAFEERYVVAERDGEVVAAVRYRMEPKRLVLGLLVADPWAGERALAVALYDGARELALQTGVREIRAWAAPYAEYPREAGYRRRGGEWRMDAARAREVCATRPSGGRLAGVFARVGTLFLPLRRAFRG
jgi:hypothetical protein